MQLSARSLPFQCHWAWQYQISANTEKHVIAKKFSSASTGRLGTLLAAFWYWCACCCCLKFCQCQHWQTWHTFDSNLALMCMALLVEILPLPALAVLAHFWQQFGTNVHVSTVWGFASAITGRLGTLLAAIWHWCLHSASEAVEAANSYSVMLVMRGVGFTKGGQNWPQICSTRLSFWDRGHFRGHTYYLIEIFAPNF